MDAKNARRGETQGPRAPVGLDGEGQKEETEPAGGAYNSPRMATTLKELTDCGAACRVTVPESAAMDT